MSEPARRCAAASFPLVNWYHDHCRTLPWRSDPTPYHVWVSEIMLQQTRVAAVLGYYARFMEALPTVADLAQVDEDTLLKLWQGLGYYNRARNLQKAARQIMEVHGGQFPSAYEDILALPGVGEYTAGAIASIAFGQPVPAVDGNVLRVIARLTGDGGDITRPETKRRIRQLLLDTMPRNLPGAYNQALMELGALVCLPNGAPDCAHCPVAAWCVACQQERTAELPVRAAKRPRTVESRRVYLLFWEDKVALRRRPQRGLLARLWEFPNEPADVTPDYLAGAVSTAPGPTGKHIFTHREWHMDSLLAEMGGPELPDGWVWAGTEELAAVYAVPSAFDAFRPAVAERLRR
ncbi:MAG: A/G-specific adenine glycosylase [Clostridiales bacterium]|nr:A/G-specific adenine glycosylase [Clostridiales bacterium]